MGTARAPSRAIESIRGILLRRCCWKSLYRPCDSFVQQRPNHDTTILSLTLLGLVVTDLAALTHGSGSQHVGQRNMPLLHQDVGDVVSPVLAELLVQGGAAYSGGVTFYLNVIAVVRHSLLRQCHQRFNVLRIDLRLAVSKQDGHLVEDVVIVELAEAGTVRGDSCLIRRDLLLLLVEGLLLRLQGCVLLFQ